jgi:hypothetical protein
MFRLTALFLLLTSLLSAQVIQGTVVSQNGESVAYAVLLLHPGEISRQTDENGKFSFPEVPDSFTLDVLATGYQKKSFVFKSRPAVLRLAVKPTLTDLSEVVVTGNMREMS